MLKRSKGRRAFTLIEVLIVVAIIGLLISIILVFVIPSREKSRDARRQSDIHQIYLAMESCYDETTCSGPEKYTLTGVCGSPPCENEITAIDADSAPLYLTVPQDPTNSGDYQYKWAETNGSGKYYCVFAKLEAFNNPAWFCASNKGVFQKEYAGPPTKDDCCGLDADN